MKTSLTIALFLLISFTALSQRGNNQIQISGHVGIPVFDMADGAKTGYGGAVRGFLGVGDTSQQVSLTVGYTRSL